MLLKRQANALRRFGLGLAAITALVGCAMAVFDVGLALAVLVWGLAASRLTPEVACSSVLTRTYPTRRAGASS